MTYSAASREGEIRETQAPVHEEDVLKAAVDALRKRLPDSWSIETLEEAGERDAAVDAVLRLAGGDGSNVVVVVQAKRLLNTRDVPFALDGVAQAASRWTTAPVVPLLAARYLPPSTRERIAELGGGYADATGNVLLRTERPALFLRDRGADRDPWRGPGRPRGSLQGPPAARVVRALVDFTPPYTVPQLVERAGTSTGATYRVVEFLEQEELLERQRYGPIKAVRWRQLIERWSDDYGFAKSNTVQTFLEPRGLLALRERLARASDLEYVLTGSLAAERFVAYATARLATIYVRDLAEASDQLGLRPVESGANVALATSRYDAMFERTETVDGVKVASASQVAVDLLTGPGRNPSEATALLEWMERDESIWRR